VQRAGIAVERKAHFAHEVSPGGAPRADVDVGAQPRPGQ
jgi:hypothetical protein